MAAGARKTGEKAMCTCGHRARSHGPNWNNESPEKAATGFPVCHYPGCPCLRLNRVGVEAQAGTAGTPTQAWSTGVSNRTVCTEDMRRESLHIGADGKRWCYHNPPRESCPACWDVKVAKARSEGAEAMRERLELAEKKLAEQGIIWEDDRYVFDGKG